MTQSTFICKTFCESLRVRELQNGYAISTPYDTFVGDPLSFYAVRTDGTSAYRVFEDGTLIPHLEAAGATLENTSRHAALLQMLEEHGASFDDHTGELFRNVDDSDDLGAACLDFMALLIRVRDLLFMVQERAKNTWLEDARIAVRKALEGSASIREGEPVSEGWG